MEYRILGDTGLKVSEIGLGTWSMGGRWWGAMDDKASIATIHRALELGVNLIDTADIYGFGHSEQLIARALEDKKRDQIIIAGKVGLRWNNKGKVRHDLSPAHIEKAIEASLQRLGTDYIDIYQIHWPDPDTAIERTLTVLQKLRDSGNIRVIGASNLSPAELDEYRKYCEISTLQPPLNMFECAAEVEILPYCCRDNIGVLTYSSLCRGLLSGRFKAGDSPQETVRKRDPLFRADVYERNIRIVEKLKELASDYQRTISQLALAWVLSHLGVHVALTGARQPVQIEESAGASGWRLEAFLLKEIDTILHCTA